MKKTYSCYYYPYEYSKPHVHLEYNNNKVNLNEAEAKALQQIENRNRKTELNKLKQKEFYKKYNKSALLYEEEQRMKNREEQIQKKKEQDEQILRIQNYNKTVYQNNMKPFLKEKEKMQTMIKDNLKLKKKKLGKKGEQNKIKKTKENKSEDKIKKNIIKIKDNEDIETKEILDNLIENDIKNKADNDSNLINKNNLNLNIKKDLTYSNKDVVDLRINLENQVLQEIKQKNSLLSKNELLTQVDNKISTIKKFRTFGLLPEETTIKNKSKKKEAKNKKPTTEYERRRFAKAINNVINEKLGEKNIVLKNICNCGKLLNKISEMIDNDDINILTEIECEKNCGFYNNEKFYLVSINQVLNSIKDLHFENKKSDV